MVPLAEGLMELMDEDRDDASGFSDFLRVRRERECSKLMGSPRGAAGAAGCAAALHVWVSDWAHQIEAGCCSLELSTSSAFCLQRCNAFLAHIDDLSFILHHIETSRLCAFPSPFNLQCYDEFLARTMADVQPPSKRRRTDSRMG